MTDVKATPNPMSLRRLIPRRQRQVPADEPPPPYSPRQRRALPTPPGPAPGPGIPDARSTVPVERSSTTYSPSRQFNPQPRAPVARAPTQDASPAYPSWMTTADRTGTTPRPPGERATFSSLPLVILHHIFELMLDPRATPAKHFHGEEAVDRAHRMWALFHGLRGVDRRCFQVATSILRTHFLPAYTSNLAKGATSSPVSSGRDADPSADPVFSRRSREAAVLDRFIAIRVGEDLRQAESALCEDSGETAEIFSRLQPAARIEDLLLTLPASLITPWDAPLGLPLPFPALTVTISPLWTQVRAGRTLVVEVHRARTPEQTVARIWDALEMMQAGALAWGTRFTAGQSERWPTAR